MLHLLILFPFPGALKSKTLNINYPRGKSFKIKLKRRSVLSSNPKQEPKLKKSTLSQRKDLSWKALRYNDKGLSSGSPQGELPHRQRECLHEFVSSFITHYPRIFFLNNIEGSTTLNLQFSSNTVSFSSENYSHQLIDKYSCYQAYKQINIIKNSSCLKEIENRQIKVKFQYSLGQSNEHRTELIKKNHFQVIIQKIKKTGVTRIPMAIINIFSLLELIKGDKDEVAMKILIRKLEKFDCAQMKVNI